VKSTHEDHKIDIGKGNLKIKMLSLEKYIIFGNHLPQTSIMMLKPSFCIPRFLLPSLWRDYPTYADTIPNWFQPIKACLPYSWLSIFKVDSDFFYPETMVKILVTDFERLSHISKNYGYRLHSVTDAVLVMNIQKTKTIHI
jgi:hypothetical protein